ncbi:MAG: hypothetical protein Q9223_002408, partial [Gallowayella weberi]
LHSMQYNDNYTAYIDGAKPEPKTLTTPDVFPNMSEAKQVQALLHDLTKGAVKGARDCEAKMEHIASDERKATMQQTSPVEAKHGTQVTDNLAAQGKFTEAERNRIARNQARNMKGSQDPPKRTPPRPPPAPKDPLAARQLQFIVYNFENAPFPVVYQVELWQSSRSLEFSVMPPAEYSEGVMETGYKPIDASPSVVLKLVGEIRTGPNAGLGVKAETTSTKFPLEL